MPKIERRHLGFFAVVACGLASRLVYWGLGVRFSAAPLAYYLQFLDPELLRHDLLRSLFYLRDQPPGYNAFLGVVLKLFPVHFAAAYGATYFACGVAFGIVLYLLLLGAGVRVWLAALVTIAFVDSPITMLYESWLFYTYPLAVLLCTSALFLQRWLTAHRRADAAIFFALLALLVVSRNLFHPLWMLIVVAALVVAERAHRRTLVRTAAIPVLIVCALLVKQVVVFHTLFQGRPIQQMNLALMTSMRVPEPERLQLVLAHTLVISEVPLTADPRMFHNYVAIPPKTGIPALDEDYKTDSDHPNWNSSLYVPIGELYGADARWALRHHPGLYLAAVRDNFQRYALPSDQTDPFNLPTYANRVALQPLLIWWNRLLSWQGAANDPALAHVIGFPLLLLFAAVFVVREARRDRARALTVAFALYSTLWVSAATILLSYGDHNRYRYKVTAFYCLFLALAVERGLQMLRTFDRGGR